MGRENKNVIVWRACVREKGAKAAASNLAGSGAAPRAVGSTLTRSRNQRVDGAVLLLYSWLCCRDIYFYSRTKCLNNDDNIVKIQIYS